MSRVGPCALQWPVMERPPAAEEVEEALSTIHREPVRSAAVQNKVEAAYARSDLFERLRQLMDDWSAYVA